MTILIGCQDNAPGCLLTRHERAPAQAELKELIAEQVKLDAPSTRLLPRRRRPTDYLMRLR